MIIRRTMAGACVWLLAAALLLSAGGVIAAPSDDDTGDEEVQAIVSIGEAVIGEVHGRMFGSNALGVSSYGNDGGGIWAAQGAPCASDIVGCYSSSAYGKLEEMNSGLLRFPGGRGTRSYLWEGGIGPAATRDFLFGTDEFLFLADGLDAEPVITVGLYDPESGDFADFGTLMAAASWVEYTNFTSPYGPVTYWEVDCDAWENSISPYNPDIQYKRVPPEAYADAFLQMSMALKDIDPSIKVGAVAYEYKNIEDTYRLLNRILESGADPKYWPDFFTMTFYRPNHDKNLCQLYGVDLESKLDEVMAATFAAADELQGQIEDVLNAVDTVWGETKANVPIMLSEYNTQLLYAEQMTNAPGDDDAPDCPFKDLSHSLGAAMFNADVLLKLLPYADDLVGAALWNFMDGDEDERGFYGSVYSHDGQAVPRPSQLALKMLSKQFRMDEIRETTVVTSTFDNEEMGRTAAYKSINIEPDEHYLRVRLVRFREPVENTPDCGPGNIHNPDPSSQIQGVYHLDNMSLMQDNLPPNFAYNLLSNGDFEQDLSVGWNTNPDPAGATTSRDCMGENCYLQVQFANTPDNNPQYLGQVMQTVEVEPGQRYRLTFNYRMQNLAVKTQNLLCDPSWEYTSTAGAYNNDYWLQYDPTPAAAQIIDTGCYDGLNCVRVPIEDNPDYYHIRQRYYLTDSPFPELADPAAYRVEGYIKTNNLDEAVTIEAQARDSGDQLVQSGDSYGVYGTADWQYQNYLFNIKNRANVAWINVHLRRKAGRKENGAALFDDVRMYRDENAYAPRVAIDVCQDAGCSVKRTVLTDGVLGTRPWTEARVAGTPLVSALAGGNEDELNVILINKDLDREVSTLVDLEDLGLEGERNIYLSRLVGASADANNELGEFGPELGVLLTGGEFYQALTESSFTVDLPPFSITGLKIIDPTVVGDDDWPDDDTGDDDLDDDDTIDDDLDDDTDDDVVDDDGGGGDSDSGGSCGC